MTEPDEPHVAQHIEPIDLFKHLEQIDLSRYIEQIDGILGDLAEFLKTAAFDPPEDGVEKCRDNGLPKACEALIKALGWGNKIKGLKYNVLRIRGASSARLKRKGSADLIPVTVWGKTPTVEGKSLSPGSITHITKDVKVQVEGESVLDLLFTVEKV